jgi:Zn-dependent protease
MPLNFALILFELVVMVLSISLHDLAQAWMANRLGDPTGRMMGRISMNPAKHFDFFGMVLWPLLFIFRSPLILGWGKPVPMTPRNFPRASRDEMVATHWSFCTMRTLKPDPRL